MTLPRPTVRRIACAIVAAETRRIREADLPSTEAGVWPDELPIGAEGLGLDSMEQLGALGALAETFELDDSILANEAPRAVGAWIDWIVRARDAHDGRITVRTSGSTGSPRACSHAVADLLGEAAFLATRLTGRRRVVALVPAHHLYGLIWTALLPDALGVPIVTRTIGTPLGLVAGDLVVAVPDQWRAMLRLTRRFPEDVVGVSSAGPLDDALANEGLAAGLARLIDVYGSSETSAIAMRDVPATSYDLLPRWRLAEHGGGDWRLIDRAGVAAELPDHVERTGERALRPIARRDGAVQVAGHNVWPERVAGVLRQIDGIAAAAVRLGANGRLKAFVVADEGQDVSALTTAIEHVVTDRLTDAERPKSLRFGPALPRNAMGKLEDWV